MRPWLLPLMTLSTLLALMLMPTMRPIAAGIAIFLFGMLTLEEGFKALTGGTLERLLTLSTASHGRALWFGTLASTLTQSSSLVSLLTISFVSAGLITLAGGIGIIFGANLGTTTGAWLMAGLGLKVDIAALAMPIITIGVLLALQRKPRPHGLGLALTGIGLLFFGIHHLKEGFVGLSSTLDISHLAIGGIRGLLIYTTIGILLTVLLQSSHAALLLIINALAVGQIDMGNALALCIGSNIGTTFTALISAVSANAAGKRLALAHTLFNVLTGIVALLLISPLTMLVSQGAHLLGFGHDAPLQLALFHSLFNALGVLLFLPWVEALASQLERLFVRDDRRSRMALPANRSDQRTLEAQPRYLSDASLQHADTLMQAVILEMRHLMDNAVGVITHSLFLHRRWVESDLALAKVVRRTPITAHFTPIDELYGRYIKNLYAALIAFSSKAQMTLNKSQSEELFALKSACRDLVNAVKDVKHLQKNLVRYADDENPYIREQYQQIRLRLAELLRALNRLDNSDEESALIISQLRLDQERQDILKNGVLDTLIRDQRITATMTASLLNDSHYVASIASHLISVAELLQTTSSAGLPTFARELSLDPDEVEAWQENDDHRPQENAP